METYWPNPRGLYNWEVLEGELFTPVRQCGNTPGRVLSYVFGMPGNSNSLLCLHFTFMKGRLQSSANFPQLVVTLNHQQADQPR